MTSVCSSILISLFVSYLNEVPKDRQASTAAHMRQMRKLKLGQEQRSAQGHMAGTLNPVLSPCRKDLQEHLPKASSQL